MAKTARRVKGVEKKVRARSVSARQVLAPVGSGYKTFVLSSKVKAEERSVPKRRTIPVTDSEWTEAQTLDYLDDLIERNAEALDGLSKL